MILVTTGGSDYRLTPQDYGILHAMHPDHLFVGDCPTGADFDVWAWVERDCICPNATQLKAEWKTLGLRAGPERNGRMLREAVSMATDTADYVLVLAFPGDEEATDCIDQARRLGIPVVHADSYAPRRK